MAVRREGRELLRRLRARGLVMVFSVGKKERDRRGEVPLWRPRKGGDMRRWLGKDDRWTFDGLLACLLACLLELRGSRRSCTSVTAGLAESPTKSRYSRSIKSSSLEFSSIAPLSIQILSGYWCVEFPSLSSHICFLHANGRVLR